MLKGIIVSLMSLVFVSCDGSAPAPTRVGPQSYAVISEQADPAAGTLILLIKVPGPITQASVKAIAESAISERKATYPHITVKLYAQDQDANAQPVAISTLEGGSVSHRFNLQTESQRIKTH
ncbi:MAG TPA: hypothetical protein VLM38_03270 [Blastocatellia bacterium]|nr:hypothetical protein [Blastocatellia bacterium]